MPSEFSGKLIGLFLFSLFLTSQTVSAGEKPQTLDAYFRTFARRAQMKPAVEDSWISVDKGYHIIGSMMSTVFAGQISLRGLEMNRRESQFAGAGAGLVIGISKELYDAQKPDNRFSWKDLTADGLGILIGFLILGIH